MEGKKQRKWYQYLIQLIVVALIVTSIPLNGLAETAPPFTPSPNSEQSPEVEKKEEQELPAPHPDQLKKDKAKAQASPTEIVEERTETEKVFDNNDGTFTKRVYTEPIHAEKDGKLEEVSPKLVEAPNEKIVTENTTLEPEFEKATQDGKYVQFKVKDHTIQYKLISANGEKGEMKPSPVTATHENNTVWYKGVFPNIDLKSTTFNENVKEDFVLREYTGHHIFTFALETDLTPSLQEDGSIDFQDEKKEKVFTLPKPYMNDSNVDQQSGEAVTSDAVRYNIEKKDEKTYTLTVTADPQWLQAPERKYPVYVDPSIELDNFENAYASSAYPTVNYSGGKLWDSGQNAYTLKVGYYDGASGTNFSFIKPDVSNLKGAKIESATFHAYAVWHYYANQPNGVWLDEVTSGWNVGSVNWNNKPGSNNIAHADVGRGKWAQFNVTNTVKAWVEGARTNNGFKLHANGNGQNHWKKFIAAENGTNAPFLEVKYSYAKPNKPRVQAYSNGSGSGSGHFNVQWDAVPGATGYKVAIFNGYDYEYIPVGNVTSWTTKDKKIFPTPEEIAQGRYWIHDDGKGAEAPTNPGQIYKNAYESGGPYGDYSGRSSYWIRIVAEYPFGDSPLSDEIVPFIPLEQVKKPDGSAYINATDKETGYVTLKWDAVPAAAGYKVWIYNGKDYEAFDVGNKTNWTTQNEKIWPTKDEIAKGQYLLHHDKKGAELAVDPSPVYKNSGGIYAGFKNYWFRVTAYSKAGHAESEISHEFVPKFSQDFGFMGMFDYWASIPVLNGQVNAFNGNFLMKETDMTLSGRGPDASLVRTYNSQLGHIGLFGKGWYSSLEEKIWPDAEGNLLLHTANGADITFTKTGENTYQAPTGVYLEIKKVSGGYEVKDKDQTVTFYHHTDLRGIGYVKDKYGNTTTYEYDDEFRLSKIKNASGKELVVQYDGNNKKAAKVIGPDSKTITFKYDGDLLVSSTTPEGKVYKYGYDNGLLTSIYDPQHTDAKPYKTSYAYENNRLVKVTDPLGKATTLTYNTDAKEVTLTNPKGRKTVYTYNDAGNPVKTVEDSGRLNLTTTYEYNANNLVKTTTPKNQTETATYDGNGNVTSVTDEMGTEKFEYNKDNGLIKATDNENRETTVAYKAANTEVSETDQAANTSSFMQYDQFGNPIATTRELGTGENLIQNPSFEMNNTERWNEEKTNSHGSLKKDAIFAPGGLGGSSSLQMIVKAQNAGWGYHSAIQDVVVEPNTTYTLSGMMKTSLTHAGAFFNVQLLKEDGTPLGSGNNWFDTRHNRIEGEKDWTNRQVTFKTTDQTKKVRIYLQVDYNRADSSGSAWFDKIQLEKGEVSSSFNPIENSSLENMAGNGCMPGWIRGDGTSCDPKDVSQQESFTGHSSIVLERSQYGGSDVGYGKHITINQKKAEPITLTGMSKSVNVENTAPDKLSRDYSIWADVHYQDGSGENFQAKFPSGTNDWNRSAVVIPATKPIKRMEVYLLFRRENKGKVWFDDIRLLEGNALIKNEYDNDGNVVAMYDEEGQKNTFTYDASGNKKSETDEKGNTKLYDYNKDNLLTKVTLKNGTSVNYRYDHNENTTEKSVMFGGKTQTHKYEYDVDNKNTVYIDALNRRIENTYDENANNIKTKMPNGSILESVYDTADRVIGEKRNGKDSFTFERDQNGQVTKVKDLVNGVERTKTYDKADRVISATDSRGGKVDWTYHDKANSKTEKLKEQTITQGGYTNKVSYDYNTLDQNIRVTDGSQTYRFDYDDQGNVRTYTAGNGSGSTFNYDHANKIKDLVVGTSNSILLSERYEYDQAGNRTKIKYEGAGGKVTETNFVYDPINQLLNEALPNGTSKSYTYDGFGNRTSVKVVENGKETKSIAATFNEGNQLVKFGNESLTYDVNGNRTSDGKYKYTWNEDNQIVAITKQGESNAFVTYKYDEDNRRIEKNVNGQVTRYFYDGDSINPLYETDGSGKVLRQYVYSVNGLRMAMKSQGQTLYYHYNPRGDVVAMTDQNREVVATYEYDSWGNVLKSEVKGIAAENPFGYAGYMYDKEIGMYYLIARYYNPEHGVFLSIDPDPGDEDDPVTQNGYTYADNNPMMMTDSDGHSPTLLINAGFAIYDGYGAYKSGANWKRIGIASAKGFVGGGRIGAAKRALKGANYLIRPGKYAKGSIPAFKGKSRNFSANTRKVINELGNKNGCHSCGVKRPGTKSGNWIPDHLPANSLAKKRVKQRLYPQCLKCSRKQGGRLSAIAKKKKAFNRRNN
ncbi:TPA: DNRLRE domain-containing protein [Bacillus cereus]|uniref:DNRLRE domain-containing protein n=1 Tax=Bacillus TaxID=1386 RepID=UPI0007AB7FD3|nr:MULTISPECIES: DNRLRE domain-containing protein [Bacillus]KZD79856.1 wall-associated protein [Bacillus cereus]MCI2247408.1 DNRLRE domain-containing protein [Bacillus cereus]MCQ6291142.1 DNRLRE domain-containing protein [Bacillus cereus]MCT1379232.1 DNRLRE domain-containing protein [Bacillus sp. p3-SID196]BCC57733.1 tRNA nuclease WapA [Bacillus cereus]